MQFERYMHAGSGDPEKGEVPRTKHDKKLDKNQDKSSGSTSNGDVAKAEPAELPSGKEKSTTETEKEIAS